MLQIFSRDTKMSEEVNADFNSDDETQFFGKRQIAEISGGVFECHTLASFGIDSEDGDLLFQVNSVAGPLSTAITINSKIYIINFANETSVETLGLDENVDCVGCTEDGKYLIAALTNGFLLIYDIASATQIFAETIDVAVNKLKTFCSICCSKDEGNRVLVVTTNGTIVNITISEHATVDVKIVPTNEIDNVSCASLIASPSGNLNIALGGSKVVLYSTDSFEDISTFPIIDENMSIKSLCFCPDSDCLLALFRNGCLSMMCPQTLISFNVLEISGLVHELTLISSTETSSEKILVLSSLEKSSSITMIETNGFREVYSFRVGQEVHLVDHSGLSDDVMFLERDAREEHKNQLLLRTIAKSRPDFHMNRLLRQTKFSEALTFASKYKLDLQLVHKAEITHHVNNVVKDDTFPKLMSVLKKIDDAPFVAECCLKAKMNSHSDTMELLRFALEKISNLDCSLDLQKQLYQAARRLETYCLLADDQQNWLDFYNGNLLGILIGFLTQGNSVHAGILWRQNEQELLQCLTSETIPDVLNVISTKTDMALIIAWFEVFVPSVLQHMPQILHAVAKILCERVSLCAYKPSENWPSEALKFCQKAIAAVEPKSFYEPSGWLKEWQNQRSLPESPTKELYIMHKALSDLTLFKEKLAVTMNLEEYAQLSTIEGIHTLLKKINSNKFPELFSNFKTLIPNSNVDPEEVISTFVEMHVYAGSKIFDSAIWEEKIIALIEFLTSQEKIASCVGRVLQECPVPWSKTINAFAVHAENLSMEMGAVVKKQRRLAGIKVVLDKYDLLPLLDEGEHSLDIIYAFRAIFFHQQPSMLEDAFVISTIRSGSQLDVHTFYIVHLLDNFKMGDATKYLESLCCEEREPVCEMLMCKVDSYIFFEMADEAVEIAAFLTIVEDCLKDLWKRKMGKIQLQVEDRELHKRIESLQNRTRAQTKFNVASTREAFHENCKGDESALVESWKRACAVGKLAEQSSSEIALMFAKNNWSHENVKFLEDILTDSLQDPITIKEVDMVLDLVENIPATNLEIIELTQLIVGRSTLLCPTGCITTLLEKATKLSNMADLMKHSNLETTLEEFGLGEMMSTKDPFVSWSFSPVFDDSPVNVKSSSETLNIIQRADSQLTSENPENTERVFSHLEKLQVDRCDLLAFCLICKYLCKNSKDPEIANVLKNSKKSLIQSLLSKVLQDRKADLTLALELLLTFDLPDALNWLETSIARVRNDCNHLFRIAQLGIDYSSIIQNREHIPKLANLLMLSCWGKKVKKLGLSPRGIMSQHFTDQENTLMKIMLQKPYEPLSTLAKFCKDFGLEVNVEIIRLVESMILNWKPNLELKKSQCGQEQLVVMKDIEFEKRVIRLVRQLHSKYFKVFGDKVDHIWDKLNPYHYEMFGCLLTLKKCIIGPQFSSIQSDILTFLEPYKRSVTPRGAEIDRWLSANPDETVLPELANYRLPFPSFMNDVLNIIKSEVTLNNYMIWLKAPTALNLDSDEICISAIKNSITDEVRLGDLSEWNLKSSEKLVEEVSECAGHMKDLSAAAAILDYACKRIPLGQDRISLMDLCHQKLLAAEEERGPDASINLEHKVSSKLTLYCVVHALHEDNLAQRQYLELASQPEELIEALYRDSSIIERVCGGVGSYPDIHSAVGKIAHITSLDIVQIRFNILSNLLFSDSSDTDSLDESFVDITKAWQQYNKESVSNTLESNTNLLKAQYMLEAGDRMSNLDFLISLINNDNIPCSNSVRLKAWRLLLGLAPLSTISEATAIPETDIDEHMRILYFLSELEMIQGQVGISVTHFKGTDKKAFVDGLWHNHSSNPRALMLIARVAVSYEILNSSLWQNLLTKMIHLKMEKELLELMPKMNSLVNLFHLQPFIKAWNFSIAAPFSKADSPMTPEQFNLCKQNLILLQKCPISCHIDIQNIFNLSLTKQRPELAAVLIPYLPPQQSKRLIQEIHKSVDLAELEIRLAKLEDDMTGFPVPRVRSMIKPTANEN
ncbi:Hypothetical predicted protein [Cloeon dipterum]|uniref:RZZ complex subunit KNTC1/ROD C-terminal domain-containing protein n=2 Tax=Cloeon dipterum TaxID=197152 RepID=A0A8S1BYG2_9INSE|nr:Hypothetical predicted protein [Cloeon dipterum]